MDIFIVINFCMCYVTYASSIGAPLELSLQCSKYHFEEKVLEKLVRLELKIEMYEAKIKTWEVSIPTNLDKLDDARKQTNTFLESMQDILYQEQIRLNDSFEETVENIHLQLEIKVKSVLDSFSTKILQFENRREHALELLHSTLLQEQERFNDSFQETVENIKTQSESRVKIILDSISFKMNEFSESHSKRENALELLQSNFLQEQERFNQSFHLMTNNIKEDINETIQNVISEQADGDGMTEYNGYYFSTFDRDHDTHSGLNCAVYEGIKGAWWFHGCWDGSGASLNGKYTSGPSAKAGIIYRKWQSNSLKKSTMMIRKV